MLWKLRPANTLRYMKDYLASGYDVLALTWLQQFLAFQTIFIFLNGVPDLPDESGL